ncbi:MAG: hypothetical protein J1F16_03610 [Muribaculaceae bacterium]|nr:hypothetical protein [Muribaculaceae bacterium]
MVHSAWCMVHGAWCTGNNTHDIRQYYSNRQDSSYEFMRQFVSDVMGLSRIN